MIGLPGILPWFQIHLASYLSIIYTTPSHYNNTMTLITQPIRFPLTLPITITHFIIMHSSFLQFKLLHSICNYALP
jgi:hypothetical protein